MKLLKKTSTEILFWPIILKLGNEKRRKAISLRLFHSIIVTVTYLYEVFMVLFGYKYFLMGNFTHNFPSLFGF